MGGPSPLDDEDTRLARELHARGLVELAALQAALSEAQGRRASGSSSSLQDVLRERGLLPPERGGLPSQLGNFRLGRRIGSGGMGLVLEAEHVLTGQLYALKLMHEVAAETDPAALTRFRREAQLASRLEHPHIVAVVDADLNAPTPWIVHALLPGGTLSERLRVSGTMSLADAVALMAPLAEALGHAHARGVLHRDLKPSNVLFDGEGRPCLADFGLARETGAQRQRLTLSGEALGTPHYMAPEQATAARDMGPPVDVYGLCAVLFHLVTGRPPFEGATALQILERIVSQPAPTPAALGVEVPGSLQALLARGLSKDPALRYRDGDELAAALRACAADALEQESSEPGSRGSQPGTRQAVGLALAAIAAGVLGAVGLFVVGRQARSAPSPQPSSSPDPSRGASSSPLAPLAPLEARELALPPLGEVAWTLGDPGAVPLSPVLWEAPGRVAAPLGALEQPGGAQSAFLGEARSVGEGRWEVRYTPHRGLIARISRSALALVHSLPERPGLGTAAPYRWLVEEQDGWLFGVPNNSANAALFAGRGRWRGVRVCARLALERIDRGQVILISGQMPGITYADREGSLSTPYGASPATWGSGGQEFLCDLRPEVSALTLGGQSYAGLLPAPEALFDPPRSSPGVLLTEGWFWVESVVVAGEPLLTDVPALVALDSRGSSELTFALRYRRSPGLGGPCIELGAGPERLRLEADHDGLSLWRGEQLLGQTSVPELPAAGILVLERRADQVEAWLLAGEERWRLTQTTPLPLTPGPLHYGASGSRLEVLGATLWVGGEAAERAAHDLGQPAAATPRGEWRAAASDLELLVDPERVPAQLRGPQAFAERGRRLLSCAQRLRRAAPSLPVPLRRDAWARALIASVYAGAAGEAQACGEALALLGASEGLHVVSWLGGGELAHALESGQFVLSEVPQVAAAGAFGIRPLLPASARSQADWTLCRIQRVALERGGAGAGGASRSASLRDLAARLEAVAAQGYHGPQGREVLEDLTWVYFELGEIGKYEAKMRELLAIPTATPYLWLGHAERLASLRRVAEGAEALLGALARGPSNQAIRQRTYAWAQGVGASAPAALIGAIYWGLSLGPPGQEPPWRELSLQHASAALRDPRTPPRERDLALCVVRGWGASAPEGVTPSAGPVGRLVGWLELTPSPELLQGAVSEDALVGHIARLQPRLAPLLGAR